MIRKLALLVLPFAAACAGPAVAEPSVDKAVTALFAPYTQENPDWDAVRALKKYSAGTEALISEWEKSLPEDEVTDLADFDWLCECQDWDSTGFRVEIAPHPEPKDGRAEVVVRVRIGWGEAGEPREQRFEMVEEADGWKIDDLFSESFPQGLKAALREAIVNPRTE